MCYFFFTTLVVQNMRYGWCQKLKSSKKGYPVYISLSKLDTDIRIDTDILENILGFHGQTACDTSSSFSGISKIKNTLEAVPPGSSGTATGIM